MNDVLHPLPGLRTQALGRTHEHHASVDSTNARAATWADEGAPHGALVTADTQSHGRGRLGRPWHSPSNCSVYATVVARPCAGTMHLGPLALAVGVGLRDGLIACGVPDPTLKWPNDVLVDGLKVAGILCEARWINSTPQIAIGFGINVHHTGFPTALRRRATSLALVMDDPPGRGDVLVACLNALEPVLDAFFAGGFSTVSTRYVAACATLGRAVLVGNRDNPDLGVRARAERLDEDGALWVAPDDGGALQRVVTADVWLAPPAPRGSRPRAEV